VPLVGRTAEEASSLAIVLRHAHTFAVGHHAAALRAQVALVGGAVEEGSTLGVVLRHNLPFVVLPPEDVLRFYVALVGLLAELGHVHRTWQRLATTRRGGTRPKLREARRAEELQAASGRRRLYEAKSSELRVEAAEARGGRAARAEGAEMAAEVRRF